MKEREREKERDREKKRGDLNHLSVHQWPRSAIRDSQQPTSPIFPIFETSATALCGTTGNFQASYVGSEVCPRQAHRPQGFEARCARLLFAHMAPKILES